MADTLIEQANIPVEEPPAQDQQGSPAAKVRKTVGQHRLSARSPQLNAFFDLIRAGILVLEAARQVGISKNTLYRLRDRNQAVASAWREALEERLRRKHAPGLPVFLQAFEAGEEIAAIRAPGSKSTYYRRRASDPEVRQRWARAAQARRERTKPRPPKRVQRRLLVQEDYYDALFRLAATERRSIADVLNEALADYLERRRERTQAPPTPSLKRVRRRILVQDDYYNALFRLAATEERSIADVLNEALAQYLERCA